MEFLIWIVYAALGFVKSIVTISLPAEDFESRTIMVFYFQAAVNIFCVWLFRKYLDRKSFRKKLPVKQGLLFVLIGIGLCWGHRIFFLLFPGISMAFYEAAGQAGLEQILNTNELMYTSVPIILYTAVAAPLTEELLMRNVCFHAALRRGHKAYAVFITAFLFAISHGNIIQFVSGFFMGLLAGYLVLLTKDFRAAVIVHMTNNTWSLLQGRFMQDIYAENPQMMESPAILYGLPILGLLILGCGVAGIYAVCNKNRT